MGLFAIAAIALVIGVIVLFVTIVVVGLLVTAITKYLKSRGNQNKSPR